MIMCPGTGLSVGVTPAPRPGTGVSAAARFGGDLRRTERTWSPDGSTHRFATVVAYPRVGADLPIVKQFRVPLSLRERSS
ncbi:hypothetical protein D5S19_04945 [Amycolatopsis panacis]|uniref:Uncharacterized protein n=1 Tax=Amycolatopsis panacis TaxID=2340917 RepID=A0A419IA06_9PSEU|nr:hypothetical protein D5S19_04945 [Amycolatopsis panacis]